MDIQSFLPVTPSRVLWSEDDQGDAILMIRVRHQDDHAAFTDLLPRVQPTIAAILYPRLPKSERDDGNATVLCRIWEKRHLYREDRGPVRVWIGMISLNSVRDGWRKKSKAPQLLSDLGNLVVPDSAPNPADLVADNDLAAYLAQICGQMLTDLPPFDRTCFRLRLAGLDYASIAVATDRSIGTIASAVHRVRKKLENRMSETLNIHGVEAPNLNATLAQMGQLQAALADVTHRLSGLEGRVQHHLDEASEESVFIPDSPACIAAELRDRLWQLISDPTQHRSITAWAEIEDLVDHLRLVKGQLAKGLFAKVWARLRESRDLLGKASGHGAALVQIRGVVAILGAMVANRSDLA